jgi:surfactin synthase thioesterase subunit
MKTIPLFCLPFAGGNKYSYRDYESKLPAFLKLVPLEYPGRGGRGNEPLLYSMDAVVEDVYNQLVKHIADKKDYALYGHSMGGLAAFLLTRKIKMAGNYKLPLHLFITGTSGPSSESRRDKKRHQLNKKEFLDEIKSLDGLPEEVLENEELLDYFEPILRADFTATENYKHCESEPLDIPFTVITGTDEPIEEKDILLWQMEAKPAVDFKRLPGKHFFIFKHTMEVMEIITGKLQAHSKIFQL